jgi:nicotinamide-nucleotide amidase
MAERNRVQAMHPEGSEAMPNSCGTAPGVWMKVGNAFVACLPGVPNEMRRMFDEQVVPRLRGLGAGGRVIVHRKINLFGRGESDIEAKALDLTARGRVPEVGITVSEATISFRLVAEGSTEAEAHALIESTAATIYERFGPMIVGEGSEDVVDALVRELSRTGTTLAVAESCTGGMIAQAITAIPGVSAVFLGGVVSYANAAKVDLLGVPAGLIEIHGAVSAEVAEAMARGARERFRADVGLSVTGIAGPSGGTTEKPVGLVYVGLAATDSVESKRFDIGSDQPREVIRARAAKLAMNWARLAVAGVLP